VTAPGFPGRPAAACAVEPGAQDAEVPAAGEPEPKAPDPEQARARRVRAIRRGAVFAVFMVATLALLVVLGHPDRLWSRVKDGQASWLVIAAVAEALSLLGYAVAFRVLVASGAARLRWRVSLEITLAGVIATKLIAAAGAGGVALNVWALRAAGLSGSEIAERLVSLMMTLYAVFMATLFLTGIGLWAGILAGSAPTALTLLPALIGLAVVGVAGLLVGAPGGLTRTLRRASHMRRPIGPSARLAMNAVQAGRAGLLRAVRIGLQRPTGLLGACLYWALDITALWASIHAFGSPPALDGVVVSYFVAQLLGALPVPGGIGVVEGGLAGALIAFGASGTLAVVGVIAYRLISQWMPTIPGVLAYASLLRTVDRWKRADDAQTSG
jgi:uncharacterized membrane protein YbhN (UPF0104 family)